LKQARGQVGHQDDLEPAMPEQDMPMPAQSAPQMGADPMMDEMSEEDIDPDSHPEMQKVDQFLADALYQQGGADHIAAALESAPEKASALGQLSYQIFSTIDEKSEGSIPDELLDAVMSRVLTEVAEIATSKQVELSPDDIVVAKRMMIENMAVELGLDSDELVEAISGVNPSDVSQFAMGGVQ